MLEARLAVLVVVRGAKGALGIVAGADLIREGICTVPRLAVVITHERAKDFEIRSEITLEQFYFQDPSSI